MTVTSSKQSSAFRCCGRTTETLILCSMCGVWGCNRCVEDDPVTLGGERMVIRLCTNCRIERRQTWAKTDAPMKLCATCMFPHDEVCTSDACGRVERPIPEKRQ